MNNIKAHKNNLFYLEKRKYKHSFLPLLIVAFLFIDLCLLGANFFNSSFQSTMNNTGYSWMKIMDSLFIFKCVSNPIFLAVLSSKSIDLENQGNMWQYLKTCNVEFKDIYKYKFIYIFRLYFLYQILEWVMMIGTAKVIGLEESFPIFRMVVYFSSQLAISFMIMTIHYNLAIKYKNQLITISISLLGSIAGVISMLLPRFISYLVPYSWYAQLLSISYKFVDKDNFIVSINNLNYFPMLISIFIGVSLYKYGQIFLKEDK
ncbi:ABC transporter permease [Peptostreptococcus faecalis]|uniref:ABC transporter permease n=1 Tax=Peptostreptococcus faecalis TaxID=2045015 RepID=UPI000C7D17E4|nr:ABC transporter permease [Peptostreptococcus faecalis]